MFLYSLKNELQTTNSRNRLANNTDMKMQRTVMYEARYISAHACRLAEGRSHKKSCVRPHAVQLTVKLAASSWPNCAWLTPLFTTARPRQIPIAAAVTQSGDPGHETTFSSTKSVRRSISSCATASCVAPSVERPFTDSSMSPLL